MSWTKRQIADEAYAELNLAGYTFDIQPEEMQRACRRLDLMMAHWMTMGINVGYALALDPVSAEPDQDSGIPITALQAVICNLALVLCPGEGKGPHPMTLDRAKAGYEGLLLAAAMPQSQQLRAGMPLGAGHKSPCAPFAASPDTSPLGNTEGGDLSFLGA